MGISDVQVRSRPGLVVVTIAPTRMNIDDYRGGNGGDVDEAGEDDGVLKKTIEKKVRRD